ncbi:MAG: response regulator, partial [Acidobacteriota bacterium]|nr:response regulator [Acidobacteriota bacterium]
MHHASILYAEDDALLRQAITELLEEAGYSVEACADGEAALGSLTSAARYDLLLFDNELPFVSGAQLTRHARGVARYSG